MRKGTDPEQGRVALELLREQGIVSEASFVLGFPDETPQSVAQTLKFAQRTRGVVLAPAMQPTIPNLPPRLKSVLTHLKYSRMGKRRGCNTYSQLPWFLKNKVLT